MIKYLLFFLLISCSSTTKRNNEKSSDSTITQMEKPRLDTTIEIYDYDTTLKGGYSIEFKQDDSLQYLYLKNQNLEKEIASCSIGLPFKNLGYKAADFNDYFILAHSFGSGNPTYIELIRKKDGENLLKEGSIWIDAIDDKELFLYSENATPSRNVRLILYDLKRQKKQYYPFPSKITEEPISSSNIKFDTVLDNSFIIKYQTTKGQFKQKYPM